MQWECIDHKGHEGYVAKRLGVQISERLLHCVQGFNQAAQLCDRDHGFRGCPETKVIAPV
jgi:hypothetical protein